MITAALRETAGDSQEERRQKKVQLKRETYSQLTIQPILIAICWQKELPNLQLPDIYN